MVYSTYLLMIAGTKIHIIYGFVTEWFIDPMKRGAII